MPTSSEPATRPGWREIDLDPALPAAVKDRVPTLPHLLGAPADARERLARLDLLVVGAGAIGAQVLEQLAALEPAVVRIVDPDRYTDGNLRTQPIGPEALGQPKVEVVGRRLKARSPRTRVLVSPGRFEALGLADVQASSAVLLAGDSLALTAAVAQRACELGQALIQGSGHGPTGVAQVRRTLPRESGPRACVCCTWDGGERRELERQTRFACDGSGRALSGASNPGGPSAALPTISNLAGSLVVTELLRWVLDLDRGQDEFVEYCALTRRAVVSPLEPSRRCPVAHARWRRVRAQRPLPEHSPVELFALAYPRSPNRNARRSLQVEGWRWSWRGHCLCDEHPPTRRFVRPGSTGLALGSCAGCKGELRVHPLHEHDLAAGKLFADRGRRTLRELGADEAWAAIVRGSSETTLVLGPEEDAR